MDLVKICNICTRKVIIKAAKRIPNSDKICCSYYDFYFGVTFFGTHCIWFENKTFSVKVFSSSFHCVIVSYSFWILTEL